MATAETRRPNMADDEQTYCDVRRAVPAHYTVVVDTIGRWAADRACLVPWSIDRDGLFKRYREYRRHPESTEAARG